MLCFIVFAALLAAGTTAVSVPDKPNILYIVVDDLRPEMNAYSPGHTMHTPAFDRLAAESVTFDRAYVQQALCNPSRASFMTGRRPDSTKVWNIETNFREAEGNDRWTTLPGMFLKAGWKSLGSGKTFHPTNWLKGRGRQDPNGMYDGHASWSDEALPYRNACYEYGVSCLPCISATGPRSFTFGMGNVWDGWCMEEALEDRLVVNHAIDLLNDAVESDDGEPFFLAVGFHKPHMPWQAKKEHFDLYDLEEIPLPTNISRLAPTGMPDIAYIDTGEDVGVTPWSPLNDTNARLARRAYYATVTGMDEQLGRLLDALEASGVADSTAIVFHSDHGWSLGEHSEWRKFTNFEHTTRVPMMVKVPWIEGSAGMRTSAFAEIVDVMPTMAELAGFDPSDVIGEDEAPLEGVSLVPLLTGGSVKEAAFSQFPRRPKNESALWKSNGIDHVDPSDFTYMGFTVRTEDWRYTEWYHWNGTALEADWSRGAMAAELYDHRGEDTTVAAFDDLENFNVVDEPQHAEAVASLSALIRGQFQHSS